MGTSPRTLAGSARRGSPSARTNVGKDVNSVKSWLTHVAKTNNKLSSPENQLLKGFLFNCKMGKNCVR